jgi:hypothetical protein
VPEHVERVGEAREGEHAEVAVEREQVDERAQVAERDDAQQQQGECAEREGQEVEVRERRAIDPRHADVVVERVHLLHVPAHRVGEDHELEPLRVLGRIEAYLPDRNDHGEQERREQQQECGLVATASKGLRG